MTALLDQLATASKWRLAGEDVRTPDRKGVVTSTGEGVGRPLGGVGVPVGGGVGKPVGVNLRFFLVMPSYRNKAASFGGR